jgi:hypothetical protein
MEGGGMNMKSVIGLISTCILLVGCTTLSASDRSLDKSMLVFLPYLNQMVDGYILQNKTQNLDDESYKEIVDKVCTPRPKCRQQAEKMFINYRVSARMIQGGFSVMICDKSGTVRKMEDFSCNEEVVEVRDFESNEKSPCLFSADIKKATDNYCSFDKK